MIDLFLMKTPLNWEAPVNDGKSVSVWYTEDERSRVEQAAALAGYKHLSKYIREKSLERSGYRESLRDSMDVWADRQELASRLAEIERSQKSAHGLLMTLLFLVGKKAAAGEIRELSLLCEKAGMPADVLAVALPEMTSLIARFTDDSM
jgi:hypothetical protein